MGALSNRQPQRISFASGHSGGSDGIHQVRFLGKHSQDGVIRGFDGDQALYQILNKGFDARATASSDVFDTLKGLLVQM